MVTFCLVFVVLFQIIFSSSFNRWNTDKKKNDSNHTTAGWDKGGEGANSWREPEQKSVQ